MVGQPRRFPAGSRAAGAVRPRPHAGDTKPRCGSLVLRGGKTKLIPRMPTLHLAVPVCPGSHLPLVLGGTWTTTAHEKQLMAEDQLFQYLEIS